MVTNCLPWPQLYHVSLCFTEKSWHVPSGYMEELQRQIKLREKLYENHAYMSSKDMNDAFLVDENNNAAAGSRLADANNNQPKASPRVELRKKHQQHRSQPIYTNQDADKSIFAVDDYVDADDVRSNDKRGASGTLAIRESEALKKLRSLRVNTDMPQWKRELIEQKKKRRSLALLTPNDLIAGFNMNAPLSGSRSNPWLASSQH